MRLNMLSKFTFKTDEDIRALPLSVKTELKVLSTRDFKRTEIRNWQTNKKVFALKIII